MKKRKFKVPHTLVILFGMVILAQILSYLIPAGSFRCSGLIALGLPDGYSQRFQRRT